MTDVSAPVLQTANGSYGRIDIVGFGANPGWRIDVHKAGTGEYLGAGPVGDDGGFSFTANYNIMQSLTGTYHVQIRQTDGSTYSYWSQALETTVL